MLSREPDGRYLVFCNTRAAAEKVEAQLKANDYKAASITGDIPQEKRMKVLSRFKDGTLSILVATDVASRGLHIEGVTHVINYRSSPGPGGLCAPDREDRPRRSRRQGHQPCLREIRAYPPGHRGVHQTKVAGHADH